MYTIRIPETYYSIDKYNNKEVNVIQLKDNVVHIIYKEI